MITVLIVEDCISKFSEIKSVLLELDIPETRLTHVNNKEDARELLKNRSFDFFILDINIFQNKNSDKITKNAGADLLVELENSILSPRTHFNIPNTIFIMSEYHDALLTNKETFNRCKVVPCQYERGSQDWIQELKIEIKKETLKNQVKIDKIDSKIVILSIHGIQTFGQWQNKLNKTLENHKEFNSSVHILYKYHYFPITHFLRNNKRAFEVDKVCRDIVQTTERFPDAKFCIVGHSFGTYLIAESLAKIHHRINVERIILAGSVLKSDYDWFPIIRKHNIKKIINECSTRDIPLLFSHFFAKGLGMAGIEGFPPHAGVIMNRYTTGGHSCFFNKENLQAWTNFIYGADIEFKDNRSDAGISDMILSIFTKSRRRWFFLGLILIFLAITANYTITY